MKLTGGWPAFLMEFHESIQDLGTADEALRSFDAELADGARRADCSRRLSLDDPATRDMLRPLADYGDLRREEIVEAAGDSGVGREDAERRLTWAHRLGLARSRLTRSLNPLVARLIGGDA